MKIIVSQTKLLKWPYIRLEREKYRVFEELSRLYNRKHPAKTLQKGGRYYAFLNRNISRSRPGEQDHAVVAPGCWSVARAVSNNVSCFRSGFRLGHTDPDEPEAHLVSSLKSPGTAGWLLRFLRLNNKQSSFLS